MTKRTKVCPHCNLLMEDMTAENYNGEGTGWFLCINCEIEFLPKYGNFQMYDTVEIIGAKWDDGSKVTGACKGYKDGKIGVSNENFWGMFPPDKLKLIRRLKDGKWVDI